MKKTLPAGMVSVDSSVPSMKEIFKKDYEIAMKLKQMEEQIELEKKIYAWDVVKPEITPDLVWAMPGTKVEEPPTGIKISNEVKRRILHAVITEMLPKSELYEWHVRGEVDLPTLAFKLDIGLSDKHPRKGKPIRIHATQLITDENLLYSDKMFLSTIVENLVDKIVHEVAKLERQRREHNDEQKHPEPVSREAEWENAEVDPPVYHLRTSTTGSA